MLSGTLPVPGLWEKPVFFSSIFKALCSTWKDNCYLQGFKEKLLRPISSPVLWILLQRFSKSQNLVE